MNEFKTRGEILEESLEFWEKKRWIFNLAVGICGLCGIASWISQFDLWMAISLLIYAALANIFYSTGYLLEAITQYYFKNRFNFTSLRLTLFLLGTIASCLLTLILSFSRPFVLL